MHRRLLVPLLVALAALLPAAPASAFSTSGGVRLDAFEYRITQLINTARTSRGLRALVVAPGLTDLARRWSAHQAGRDVMSHNPSLAADIARYGSPAWRSAGENVGHGWDADSLFTAYMNSPGHRANILRPEYRYLGIGWAERADGSGYNTQDFADQYSGTYGHNREPAYGGLADRRTPAASTSLGTWDSGAWDPRLLTRTTTGITVTAPAVEAATAGDDGVRFGVRETAAGTGGAGTLTIRESLDLRNVTRLRVRLSAVTATGRPLAVAVSVRREWGAAVPLGTVTVASGKVVSVELPLPAGARDVRNAVDLAVGRATLDGLGSALSQRFATVRLLDLAVLV